MANEKGLRPLALLNVDLAVTQGEDWSNTWLWANPDPSGQGNLLDIVWLNLAGCAARMTVRAQDNRASAAIFTLTSAGGNIVFSSATIAGATAAPVAANAFSVSIPKALSLAQTPGQYYYDLFVDFPANTSTCFLKGQFELTGTVT